MSSYPNVLKKQAEKALADPNFDFIATYHAVTDLRRLARKKPDVLNDQTVLSLKEFLLSNPFSKARQAYFLYREAAKGLTDIVLTPGGNGLGEMALASLQDLLVHTTGSPHRGVAEAVGCLPVNLSGPPIDLESDFRPIRVSWDQLINENNFRILGKPEYIGRSLVARATNNDRLLVLKLAQKLDTPRGLLKEIRWMEKLEEVFLSDGYTFHIPHPLQQDGFSLIQVSSLPADPPCGVDLHTEGWAIAFFTHRDYFIYPNSDRIDSEAALEILGRNAFLLGRLSANGIIHDAPIPLFHNRTQRLRREDQGRYQWFRAGRLDQWLDSCEFPNLGLSGVRDFEHFETFNGHGRILYRHIGTHIFSLLLIAGSHFRCKDKSRFGLNEKKEPVDTRDLFDRKVLMKMVEDIFSGYYKGFTNLEAIPPLPVKLDLLIDRMIDEMGMDRYMTELFRRTDQNALTDDEFIAFLKRKGYTDDRIRKLKKGEKDILITSGPHLGEFNRQISLPELIECTAAMSALCIAGRYLRLKNHTPAKGLQRRSGETARPAKDYATARESFPPPDRK
jgi:hypothetical protein